MLKAASDPTPHTRAPVRLRHLVVLLALAGCAGARTDSSPEPETVLREVILLYVEPVKSQVESEYATLEMRRMLQESGRFLVVDDPSVAHAIVRTTLTLPLADVTDRTSPEVSSRNRRSAAGTSAFSPPTGHISVALRSNPDHSVWSRSFVLRRWRPSEMQLSSTVDQATVRFLVLALSGRLRGAAGPADDVAQRR